MSDDVDYPVPVKAIVKAFDNGVKLTRRAAKSASAPDNINHLIVDAAVNLQDALEQGLKAIATAYTECLTTAGAPFAAALVESRTIQLQLKELRADFIEQINECQDFDDSDTFDPNAFLIAQQHARRCSTECLRIFFALRVQLAPRASLASSIGAQPRPASTRSASARSVPNGKEAPIDSDSDSNMSRSVTMRKPVVGAFASRPLPPPPVHASKSLKASRPKTPKSRPPEKPENAWVVPLDSPTLGGVTGAVPTADIETMDLNDPNAPPLIPRALVTARLEENDTFLVRRKQSKEAFQKLYDYISLPHAEREKIEQEKQEKEQAKQQTREAQRREEAPLAREQEPKSLKDPRLLENRLSDVISDAFDDDLSEVSAMTSPIDNRSSMLSNVSSNYESYIAKKRSQQQDSHWSSSTFSSMGTSRSSRAISTLSATPTVSTIPEGRPGRSGRPDSEQSLWSMPPTPQSTSPLRTSPLSTSPNKLSQVPTRSTSIKTWGSLATTLQVPGFGQGVEEGLEAVSPMTTVQDTGLMLANEQPVEEDPLYAAAAARHASISTAHSTAISTIANVVDTPMRHDCSFFKMGGFCEGAKLTSRGETGLRVMKRPAGQFSASVSARCIKCPYEIGWADVEKDRRLAPNGIYGNNGIRWRQKFLTKCHLKMATMDEPLYACVFCVEEHKTVEEHDATVFFSVTSLFRHIAKHSRPLPYVQGVDVVYGLQSTNVVDFDVHFTLAEPVIPANSMGEIGHKIAGLASASSNTLNRGKHGKSRDPDNRPTLQFAVGARIVGITLPDRFNGQWCEGYHDGEYGAFPSSYITLETPPKDEVLMHAQSTLVATVKWDFKPPKGDKESGWLKLSKGDKLENIGYNYFDQWCWSGKNHKGKWGIFPSAYVDLARDDRRGGNGSSNGSGRSSYASNGGVVSVRGDSGLNIPGTRVNGYPITRHKSNRSISSLESAQTAFRPGTATTSRTNTGLSFGMLRS